MGTAEIDLPFLKVLANYRLFLKNLPEQVNSIKTELNMLSDKEFKQRVEPSLVYVLPVAKNKSDSWSIEFNQMLHGHYNLCGLIADLIFFAHQLAGATALMTKPQRSNSLSTLNLQQPPFSLAGLAFLHASSPVILLQQIKLHIHDAWKKCFDSAFHSSTLSDGVSLVIPRIINFMDASIDIYAARCNINLDLTITDSALDIVIKTADKTRNDYTDTLIAASDLYAYLSNIHALLDEPDRLIARVFQSSTINELNEAMKGMVPSLNVLKEHLQKL